MPSVKSSSAEAASARLRQTAGAQPGAPAPLASDQDALDAIAFAQRGRPDGEIGYSEDAPRLTPEQLAEFEPASFRFAGLDNGPARGSNQILFEKAASQLIVAAYDSGALIVHGWTVSIGLDDVRTYVADFGRNMGSDVQGGFFFLDGSFIISHKDAKLTLTAEEGTAIVKFLSGHYGLE